jgi:hypothetical protein
VANDKFSTLWFSGLMLGLSIYMIVKGGRIAWRREIDTPVFEARGPRALGIGLAIVAVGLVGIALAAVEGMKLRG